MDMSLVSAMLGAQTGMARADVAAKFMRMNADSATAIAKVVETAAQNANALANVAEGVGTNLDIRS